MMISSKIIVFFALEAAYFSFCHSSLDSHPEETLITAFFKCGPIAFLIWVCGSTRPHDSEHKRYRDEVTMGLIFSILGDVCLVWRHGLFIPGASFFAIAHLFYIRAFRMKPWGLETGGIIFLAEAVVFMFFVPALKVTMDFVIVPAYLTLIFTVWWRAVVRWQRNASLSTLLANFGTFIFICSDFCLAIDKWLSELPMAAVIIMTLYYLAQFLVTMSVYVYHPPGTEDEDLREKKRG